MSSSNHCARALRAAIKIVLITAASAPALSAFAQQAPAANDSAIEEVVVSGFRVSLEKALDEKKLSAAAIDSIKAEDIAKFPDSNLAESLQRIPGVSISRDAGEGRNLTVRGLGAQFTRVRINGMEALTTTGSTDSSGGNNRDRPFDFNVFASELFGSITARKTASADVDEGSLGATVDLQTARPFDYQGFTFATSAKGIYNDLSGDTDPRVSALISNTWADGKFGALLSAAYSKRRSLEEGFTTVRWDTGGSVGGFAATSTPPPGTTLAQLNSNNLTTADPTIAPTAFHPRIPRYSKLAYDQDRIGVTGSLQWAPNAANSLNLDVLYSDFQVKRDENYLEAFSFSRTAAQFGKPATVLRQGEIDGNKTLVYGLFDGVDMRTENRHDEFTTKFEEATLTGKHELTDRLTIDESLGYQKSDFDNPIQTTITLDRQNSNGYSWDFRGSSRLPALSYGFDVTDPNSWQFSNAGNAAGGQSEIRLRPNTVVDTFKTANVNVTFKAIDQLSIRGGLEFKKFGFDATEMRRASETSVPVLPAGTSLASVTKVVSCCSGLNLPAGTPTSWLIADIGKFDQLFNIYSNSGTFAVSGIPNAAARGNNRGVQEEDQGAFAQANFNFEAGIPWRGDFGVRYVKTKQSSYGYVPTTTIVRAEAEHEYSDVLPALNLVGELSPDLLMRFGLAKVMARPSLAQVTPGGTVSTVGNLSVSTGNPLLDPIRAKTADLSLEWYFGRGSLLSGAVFYKDIGSFVQTLTTNAVYNTTGLPLSLLAGTTLTGNEVFAFNAPVNTPGGKLKGAEVNYQQQFRNFPGFWSHLGLLLNYTYVDSEINYVTSATGASPPVTQDLLNLSRNAFNATIFYEDDHLSVRASAAYRDKYITKVPASNAFPIQDVEGTNSTLNIDASVTYSINGHFSVSLEGLNLTDEFNDQYIDSTSNRVVVYTHTGRLFMLGARYKF